MAYTPLATVNTSDPWSASDHNTYIKDNFAYFYALKRPATIKVFHQLVSVTTGDGKEYFPVPESYNGMNLVGIVARVITAGTTGTTDVQVCNVTDSVDMLSTKCTIDSGETSSATAAAAAVIDTSHDDVATGDLLRIDVDAVSTTAPKGLYITLLFANP